MSLISLIRAAVGLGDVPATAQEETAVAEAVVQAIAPMAEEQNKLVLDLQNKVSALETEVVAKAETIAGLVQAKEGLEKENATLTKTAKAFENLGVKAEEAKQAIDWHKEHLAGAGVVAAPTDASQVEVKGKRRSKSGITEAAMELQEKK